MKARAERPQVNKSFALIMINDKLSTCSLTPIISQLRLLKKKKKKSFRQLSGSMGYWSMENVIRI